MPLFLLYWQGLHLGKVGILEQKTTSNKLGFENQIIYEINCFAFNHVHKVTYTGVMLLCPQPNVSLNIHNIKVAYKKNVNDICVLSFQMRLLYLWANITVQET